MIVILRQTLPFLASRGYRWLAYIIIIIIIIIIMKSPTSHLAEDLCFMRARMGNERRYNDAS